MNNYLMYANLELEKAYWIKADSEEEAWAKLLKAAQKDKVKVTEKINTSTIISYEARQNLLSELGKPAQQPKASISLGTSETTLTQQEAACLTKVLGHTFNEDIYEMPLEEDEYISSMNALSKIILFLAQNGHRSSTADSDFGLGHYPQIE